MEKYNIDEGFASSFLHILCCPGASLVQMLMEVEEREGGEVGCLGFWREKKTTGKEYNVTFVEADDNGLLYRSNNYNEMQR